MMDAFAAIEASVAELKRSLEEARQRERLAAAEAQRWKAAWENAARPRDGDGIQGRPASAEEERAAPGSKRPSGAECGSSPRRSCPSPMREQDSSLHVFRRGESEYGNMQSFGSFDGLLLADNPRWSLRARGHNRDMSLDRNSNSSSSSSSDSGAFAQAGGDLDPEGGDGECSIEPKYLVDERFNLRWRSRPSKVLLVAKRTPAVLGQLSRVAIWLASRGFTVFLEPEAHERAGLSDTSVVTWSRGPGGNALDGGDGTVIDMPRQAASSIDFAITLGGDGTVLWASTVMGNLPSPPVVSFALGSLGFMTPFPLEKIEETVSAVVEGKASVTYRHRLQAFLFRRGVSESLAEDMLECAWQAGEKIDACDYQECHHVLNEITIDRGESTFITNLEVYCDRSKVTNVQGDGLIVATPSGSTAYSMAAGGSICHPEVPAILLTPICPHSLSFRPLIFPHQVKLTLRVPERARNGVNCSFDGKHTTHLDRGDCLVVCMSPWPLRAICRTDTVKDWLSSLSQGLHYNKRRLQQELH